ncbi:MAG: hypothetical protein ABI690_08010 [Chloroflexota bacterium]
MSISALRWGIFWRMCLRGIIAGAACGALFGTILPITGTMIGIVVGGCMGFPLGILNGLYLSSVTTNYYYPPRDFELYQRAMSAKCALISGLGIMIILGVTGYLLGVRILRADSLMLIPMCMVFPAIVGSFFAVSMSNKVTAWYKMKLDSAHSSPLPQGDRG